METSAKLYTNDIVVQMMGELFDYGVNICNLGGDMLWDAFVQSNIARQIETANPKYMGMSCVELLKVVYQRTRIYPIDALDDYISFDRSPEYWAGWVLAQYQLNSQQPYAGIHRRISFAEIVRMYYPYHEAPAEKVIDAIAVRVKRTECGLKVQRERAGLSQSELAAQVGVSTKSIQAYEQGYKDIASAKFITIKRIARTLGCLPDDLL